MNEFIVIIHTTPPCPLRHGGEMAVFSSDTAAMDAANDNDLANSQGFDVFELGCGIDGGDPL